MAEPSNISTARFAAAAAWASLTPAEQARVGAAALDLCVARGIAEHAADPASRAGYEAERLALDVLLECVLDAGRLDYGSWTEPAPWGSPHSERFRLPHVIGPVCLSCGCSEDDACEGGCGWHDETTCTACAPATESSGTHPNV